MFSNAAEYAIKACVWIALHSKKDKYVTIEQIVENTNLPRAFTAKNLQTLARHKVISSVKGPNGGFCIKNPEELTILSIVQAIDGNGILNNCVLGLKVCSDIKPCPLHANFKPIRSELTEFMINSTIADLAKDLKEGKAFLKL